MAIEPAMLEYLRKPQWAADSSPPEEEPVAQYRPEEAIEGGRRIVKSVTAAQLDSTISFLASRYAMVICGINGRPYLTWKEYANLIKTELGLEDYQDAD